MYRIMLADDEGIVIDSLKFIIEKEFGELCEIRYAKTGRRTKMCPRPNECPSSIPVFSFCSRKYASVLYAIEIVGVFLIFAA